MATKAKSTKKSVLEKQADRKTSCVTLRKKPISKGRASLYLDYYQKGKGRKYEFLGLYLVKAVDEATKIQNKNILEKALKIRSERETMLASGISGLATKISLIDWMKKCKDDNLGLRRRQTIDQCIKHLEIMGDSSPLLASIDKDTCLKFIKYLKTAKSLTSTRNGRTISASTAELYFSVFSSCITSAVRKGLCPTNPCTQIDPKEKIRGKQAKREFLDIEELRKFAQVNIERKGYAETKRAFLFSCFTGIRVSDVRSLTWDDVKTESTGTYIEIVMKKTGERLKLKLNEQARALLGSDKGFAGGVVFDLPNDEATVNYNLRQLSKKAGIKKNISFHTARHTFAVTQITLGTDIYVVSRLLGHKKLSTTEIYADIVCRVRDEAMDKMNNII